MFNLNVNTPLLWNISCKLTRYFFVLEKGLPHMLQLPAGHLPVCNYY